MWRGSFADSVLHAQMPQSEPLSPCCNEQRVGYGCMLPRSSGCRSFSTRGVAAMQVADVSSPVAEPRVLMPEIDGSLPPQRVWQRLESAPASMIAEAQDAAKSNPAGLTTVPSSARNISHKRAQ